MKILAVDYGTKRLGVAMGADREMLFSKTLEVSSEEQAIEELTRLINQEEIGTLIFGLPLRLDGSEREEARGVRRFAARVAEGKHLPVVFVDERLSSEEARSILREQEVTEKEMRGKIDKIVAELLLEQYYRQRG